MASVMALLIAGLPVGISAWNVTLDGLCHGACVVAAIPTPCKAGRQIKMVMQSRLRAGKRMLSTNQSIMTQSVNRLLLTYTQKGSVHSKDERATNATLAVWLKQLNHKYIVLLDSSRTVFQHQL